MFRDAWDHNEFGDGIGSTWSVDNDQYFQSKPLPTVQQFANRNEFHSFMRLIEL